MQGNIKDDSTIIGEDNKEYSYTHSDLNRVPYDNNFIGKKVDFTPVENKATMIFEVVYSNPHEFPLIQSFKKYFDFDSRSSRKEFWVTSTILLIITLITDLLSTLIYEHDPSLLGVLAIVDACRTLVFLIPSWSLMVRRLHDINRTGLWLLIIFIPFVGFILLVFFLTPGTKGTNRYGLNPYYFDNKDKKQ